MIDLGSSGYLLFTARWASSPSDLEALRHELAARAGLEDAGRITLSFAPVQSPRCDVSIRDGDGEYPVIATSTTSGFPPYNAVFNLRLDGDRLAGAKAAIDGTRDVMRVEYRADLPATTAATARFQSTAGDLLAWLRSHETEGGLRTLLEEAIRSGRAEIQIDLTEPGAAGLADELYERALTRAEAVLAGWLDGYETGDVRIDVTVEHVANEPVRAFVDIGEISATRRDERG